MKRLLGLALFFTMNASGGMGISMSRWREFRADASFIGVFKDFRGPRAAFFVEDKTGLLIGPLDLDVPSGPGWPQTPGAEPKDLKPGDHVSVVYAGVVDSDRPIGHPPAEDLSKTRIDRRKAEGPLDGVFVSAEKRGAAIPLTNDPLTHGLDGEQAVVGWLLRGDQVKARAVVTHLKDPTVFLVILDGLKSLPEPLGPIARLWSAGKKDEARALVAREKEKLHFFVGSDRWKHPPHPMESTPGAPLLGPFWRMNEYRGQEYLALRYVAPEFLQFLIEELHWSEPPF